MSKKTVRIIVYGLVHGVFYRQSTQEMATMLNIQGTVRNCEDGTVEIFAEGDEGSIEKLAEWCKNGPPDAKVMKVVIENIQLKSFVAFKVIR